MRAISIIFTLFVVLNIAASQWFPKMYFLGLDDEKATAVPYLKSIQSLPEFSTELESFTNLYGQSVRENVYYDETVRNKYIEELETLREKNPASRDIYYQLSILYRQSGDMQKSRENLQKAREIDPAI